MCRSLLDMMILIGGFQKDQEAKNKLNKFIEKTIKNLNNNQAAEEATPKAARRKVMINLVAASTCATILHPFEIGGGEERCAFTSELCSAVVTIAFAQLMVVLCVVCC